MQAEILTIGDEILIGQILDSNSQWIAQKLNTLGINVYQITSVQDRAEHIVEVLDNALKHVDIVLITGGLGPTKDDITKRTLARYFNDELVKNEAVEAHIKKLFEKMKFRYVESDLQQAYLPSKAQVLHNAIGTASGMWFEKNDKVVVSLPGVPAEMKSLMEDEVLPKIKNTYKLPFIIHKTLITFGVREAEMALQLEDFENNLPESIKLAYLPNYRRLRLRLTAKGEDKEVLEQEMQNTLQELIKALGSITFGFEDFLLEHEIGKLLRKNKQKIATAESFTGGNIARLITSVPGASDYFVGSIVSYDVQIKKEALRVPEKTIATYSVVSAEVAEAMAKGIQQKWHTDFAIATTGNAGPTTDKTNKSVGDVFIAIATPDVVRSYYFNFGQPREKVINRASSRALELLYKAMIS